MKGGPKVRSSPKSEVGSQTSEEEDKSAIDTSHSEIKENSVIDTPHSEIKELPTANSKLFQRNSLEQPETMEVHHHPQLEHNPKPWKEYLLEGMMIFLAVFMGFIAENIRENITNREHVKQLASQLLRDLKNDTLQLNQCVYYESRLVKRNDTLFHLLQQPIAAVDKKEVQRLIFKSYNLKLFYPSLGAISAIKSELHIRQFSNSKIALYIAEYEGRAHVLKVLEDIQTANLTNSIESFIKDHVTPANAYAVFHDKPVVDAEMRNVNQNDFTRLATEIAIIQTFNKDMVSSYKRLEDQAVEMMDYVKKQYDPEDE
jgi:hypothetical protein